MVTILGSRLCKDCILLLEQIEENQWPARFLDMTLSLANLRLYLRYREETADLSEALLKEDKIGIPLFLLEDGTITTDEALGYAALRSSK